MGIPRWLNGKEFAWQCRRCRKFGSDPWGDSLEEEMAIHSSILAWKIPWTEEPGGLFIGLHAGVQLSQYHFLKRRCDFIFKNPLAFLESMDLKRKLKVK